MNTQQPIFTEATQCQDCYRCVRNCPVKAIKIEQGCASVVEALCISCGKCVNICPAKAKQVRNDAAHVKELLRGSERVIVSLAPSYMSEFGDIPASAIIAALKRLGFFGVSETALGAQEVSSAVAQLIEAQPRLWISSACPTVVEYIRKYRPELTASLTPTLSPLLVHARMIKQEFGMETKVVFFGPCIAKKLEATAHPELLAAALTFADLRQWLAESGIDLCEMPLSSDDFIPRRARDGALYPVDGGMIAGIKNESSLCDRTAMHFSGVEEIGSVLDPALTKSQARPLLLELLACAGGCINGPLTAEGNGTCAKRCAILDKVDMTSGRGVVPSVDTNESFAAVESRSVVFSDAAIADILHRTGKFLPKDELNCDGCGYGNCRDFARAVLNGKAETAMCVTYMRQLANKKANKLIMAMPSGVVIVDRDLKIIECNGQFAALAGEETAALYGSHPGLSGASLEKVFPVAHLFRYVLDSKEDVIDKDLRVNDRIIHCSLFSIEPGSIVGGIFGDVTAPTLHTDEIIKRAQDVIRNNLTTVQKIAYLLGENASQTEIVLSTIIDSYTQNQEKITDERL